MGLMDKINENIEFLKGEFDGQEGEPAKEHAEMIKEENEKRLRDMEGAEKDGAGGESAEIGDESEGDRGAEAEGGGTGEGTEEDESGEAGGGGADGEGNGAGNGGYAPRNLGSDGKNYRRHQRLEAPPMSKEDEELAKFIEASVPKIFVVGTGGSGCNTVNRMNDIGIFGANIIAMNTDAQHLLRVKAQKKVLLGRQKTRGLGAGSNPEVGEAAAAESAPHIKELLKEANLVFVTCGMGGGTGTGSAHVIAKAAKENGALVVGIVTMPFTSEGTKRMENAMDGLRKLRAVADTTIAIPNDKLLFYVPDLPLNSAFKAADLVLTNAVKGITELITRPGLVNLDFADVRTIIENSGIAMIGLGETANVKDKNRVVVAAEKSLKSPLIDVNLGQANKALINIMGGEDLTLGEAEAAVNAISNKISKDAHIIWGATIDKELSGGEVRVLAVLAGMRDDGASAMLPSTDERIEETLNLDFIT